MMVTIPAKYYDLNIILKLEGCYTSHIINYQKINFKDQHEEEEEFNFKAHRTFKLLKG